MAARPIMARSMNSGYEKESMNTRTAGSSTTRTTTPTREPSEDAMAEIPRAYPALPWRDNW